MLLTDAAAKVNELSATESAADKNKTAAKFASVISIKHQVVPNKRVASVND